MINVIENYRPIVVLCNFGKLIEMIIAQILSHHIDPQIMEYQPTFITGRSTITNLVNVTQYAAETLGDSSQVDVIYTDFSKAVDRLD